MIEGSNRGEKTWGSGEYPFDARAILLEQVLGSRQNRLVATTQVPGFQFEFVEKSLN
jgi:hypothetical protein